VENRFQRAAANGPRLVGNGKAVFDDGAGVHVANLAAGVHRQAVVQEAAQHTIDPGNDSMSRNLGDPLTGPHQVADAALAHKEAADWRSQHSPGCLAPHLAGYASVGLCLSVVDDPPQIVASHGIYDGVAVSSSGEARAQRHHDWCVGDFRASVALGYDRVYDDVGAKPLHDLRLRIHPHWHFAGSQCAFHARLILHPAGDDAFYFPGSFVHR
jgi:hypothetical protein